MFVYIIIVTTGLFACAFKNYCYFMCYAFSCVGIHWLYLQKKESKPKNKKYVNIYTDEGLNRQEVFLKGKNVSSYS